MLRCPVRPRVLFSVLALAAAAVAADDSDALLTRIRARINENVKQLPRYTCIQTVRRERLALPAPTRSCDASITPELNRTVTWSDRLRLDVAVGDEKDLYSWVGASRFDNDEVRQLAARGMSASGEFANLLAGVFGGDARDFLLTGPATYSFNTPQNHSHFLYGTNSGRLTVGYHGTFQADPTSSDLRRLTISAENLPGNVCRMEHSVDYARQTIGGSDFLLPSTSSVDVLYIDGTESRNQTAYSGCRQYLGESTIHFEGENSSGSPESSSGNNVAALLPLPPKTRLHIRISPPLDTATAAAGDQIIGVVTSQVKDNGRVLASTGDKLLGRIVRLEHVTTTPSVAPPPPSAQQAAQMQLFGQRQPTGITSTWVLAVVFDTLERGGATQPVKLRPLDDGYRTIAGVATGQGVTQADRPAGGGMFIFRPEGGLILDQKFESAWETQASTH